MKIKIISKLLFAFVALLFYSCATKIPFEQTCLTCVQSQRLNCKGNECPETIMAGNNCIAAFDETGEKINMNYILEQEKISFSSGIPVSLAKIRGKYFVTGKGFKKLWILTPVRNEAKIKGILLPEENLNLPPVFEIVGGNLLMRGINNEFSFIFDIDKQKWITSAKVKAGA